MVTAPEIMVTPSESRTSMATLPLGSSFTPTPSGAVTPLPLAWNAESPNCVMQNSFAGAGNYMLAPNYASNDVHRTSSQPSNKRRSTNHMDWSTARNNRDTLYAHEFLKAFRARMPDSSEGQAACDYCRKRKIKVRRVG